MNHYKLDLRQHHLVAHSLWVISPVDCLLSVSQGEIQMAQSLHPCPEAPCLGKSTSRLIQVVDWMKSLVVVELKPPFHCWLLARIHSELRLLHSSQGCSISKPEQCLISPQASFFSSFLFCHPQRTLLLKAHGFRSGPSRWSPFLCFVSWFL